MTEQLEQLTRDLETDQAVSEGQLKRHYGHSVADLPPSDFTIAKVFLAPSQGSLDYQKVMFIGLSSKVRRLEGSSLRHLAGIAEMRRILKADTDHWTSLAAARRQPRMPDALWETAEGLVAVEYDVGSYSPTQIRDKARSFRRYVGQVWGAPSQDRVKHLGHHISNFENHYNTLFVLWDR